MLNHGILPDNVVTPSALKACAGLLALKIGRQIHSLVKVCGFESDSFVQSSLIDVYVKCGEIKYAHILFDRMSHRNVVSSSVLIAGYARQGYVDEAKKLFNEMRDSGVEPNLITRNGLIAGQLEDLKVGIQVHSYVIKQGLGPDNWVVSALIDMYGKCGCATKLLQVFKEMAHMDVVSCNALVSGLSRNGRVDDALKMFRQFNNQGIKLNVVS
ncbi:pentatricopeptide repeat-containing protein At1g20230-like [Papaver somniferum]|uniref:pentatricopeptide repeat-containing protein At1g20230-like n=1 Tax=Papaver somniferum TaxID=3469 RepID=UPI000E6F8332|nr:pentatricopeptide repeat-containing protein At1g20230-like [Papaver somniferum]